MSITKFHVHKGNLKENEAHNKQLPPIVCTDANGEEELAHLVIIYGQDGKEAARIVYDPEAVNKNSVKVWMETQNRVEKYQTLKK